MKGCNKDMNMEKFTDSFLQFEYEYGMFQFKMGEIKIWHLIRFQLYYHLAEQFGLGKTLLDVVPMNKGTVQQTWRDIIREKVVCNQFRARKRDVLIFPSTGKYKDNDGYYRCKYTDLLDKAMKRSHYLLDGKSDEGVYVRQRSKNILYSDLKIFKKIYEIKNDYGSISKLELNEKIVTPIEEYYKIKIDVRFKQKWLSMINTILRIRGYFINYYNYMLNRIKPKIIIITCAYDWDKMFLCEVAKKKNIPVVELEHGAIGRLHISYNFLKKMNLPNFPDYIFTFGQLEKVRPRFPIDDNRVIPVGFPELEDCYIKCSKNHLNVKKNRKQILFVSQGIVELAQYADAVAGILDSKKYRIIYKLHPKEYGNWKDIYKGYLKNPNIEVCGDYKKTMHSFLAESDWVIGSYSTSLYEATMFDVKIALIKTTMLDDMKDLYSNGYALLVESPQQLAQEIIEDTFNMSSGISIFEKNSIRNMLKWIDKIILTAN